MTTWQLDEVRGAVAACIHDYPDDSTSFEVASLLPAVRTAVSGLSAVIPRQDEDKLHGQVKRILDQMAAAAQLVKISRGYRHPSGCTETGTAYYLPRNFSQAVKKAQQELFARQAEAERWAAVHSKLTGAEFTVYSVKGHPVTLDLAGWERLAALLPTGQPADLSR